MRKIGEIGNDPSRELAEAICLSIKLTGGGVHIDHEGKVWHLQRHQELSDVQVRSGDAYVVGPHGEIVPFVAKAMKDRAIPNTGNRLMHIDAHLDNLYQQYDGRGYTFESSTTGDRIGRFLVAQEEAHEYAHFDCLANGVVGDIETFISALMTHNSQIAAFIRKELNYRGVMFGPMAPVRYAGRNLTANEMSNRGLGETIREMHPTIYSMDADILGAFRECFNNTGAEAKQIMINTIHDVFEGMKAELALRQNPPSFEGVIYTISVDPAWCVYPERFVQEFIDRFYLQLLRQNTARRTGNVVTQG